MESSWPAVRPSACISAVPVGGISVTFDGGTFMKMR